MELDRLERLEVGVILKMQTSASNIPALHVAREGRTLTDFHCTVEARAELNVRFGLATE